MPKPTVAVGDAVTYCINKVNYAAKVTAVKNATTVDLKLDSPPKGTSADLSSVTMGSGERMWAWPK